MLRVRLRRFRKGATILAGLAIVLVMAACTGGEENAVSPTAVVATAIPTIVSTPYRLLTPTPAPFTNLDRAEAEILVWAQISECANQVTSESGSPAKLAFNSEFRIENSSWTVEASSPGLGLNLGSWRVDDLSKQVAPLDVVSETISSNETICKVPTAKFASGLTPPLFAGPNWTGTPLTGDQASLKVWIAIRSCYASLLPLESFTAYSESPQRWLVVGSGVNGVDYGMWFVDTVNGNITPHDSKAITTAGNTGCFFTP